MRQMKWTYPRDLALTHGRNARLRNAIVRLQSRLDTPIIGGMPAHGESQMVDRPASAQCVMKFCANVGLVNLVRIRHKLGD